MVAVETGLRLQHIPNYNAPYFRAIVVFAGYVKSHFLVSIQ